MPPSDSPQPAAAAGLDARRPEKRKRAPKRIKTTTGASLERVRGWIEPIACTWIWRDDLADLFWPRRPAPDVEIPAALTRPSGRKACHRVLAQSRHYPPGGHATVMHRCLACGHWTPRN